MHHHDDDRFYTPRAQASTSRSTASYGTPRSSSDPSSARSNPPFQNDYESNRAIHQYLSDTSMLQYPHYALTHGSYPPSLIEPSAPSISYNPPTTRAYENKANLGTNDFENKEEAFSFARHGRIDELESLLKRGLPVDIRDESGNTILAIACQNGNKRVVKLALRYGADINAKNQRGNTPLHFCFKYGFADSLGAYLLSKGADISFRNSDEQLCTDTSPFEDYSNRN